MKCCDFTSTELKNEINDHGLANSKSKWSDIQAQKLKLFNWSETHYLQIRQAKTIWTSNKPKNI